MTNKDLFQGNFVLLFYIVKRIIWHLTLNNRCYTLFIHFLRGAYSVFESTVNSFYGAFPSLHVDPFFPFRIQTPDNKARKNKFLKVFEKKSLVFSFF